MTVQDRAAIAKGLKEGCSLRRTADRIVWIGVRGISGDTPQRREVWVSARVAADVKAQKRRSRPKTRKIDAASGPQGSGAGGFEAFQDTPAKSSRGLRAEACDGSLEIRARAPRVPKERLCPTRPSTPGFYTPYRQAGSGPSQDHAALEAHQTQAASTWWGSAPIRSWGWSALMTAPRMWMIVGSQGTGRVT